MNRFDAAIVAALLMVPAAAEAKTRRPAPAPLAAEAVNTAQAGPGTPTRALLVRTAVLLDRARVSPGAIDGRAGDNLGKAVRAFRAKASLPEGTVIDAALLAKLTETDVAPALVEYTVTEADAEGPFDTIPKKLEEQGGLKRLGYADPGELLAERFHTDAGLLRELNRGKPLDRVGTVLTVPNVAAPAADPSRAAEIASGKGVDKTDLAVARSRVARLAIDKAAGSLSAFDKDGRLLAFYPATVGSAEKPAPSGTLRTVRVVPNPSYTYNPDYAFKGVRARKKFDIAPGPNNPVGSVWIALDREGYGIHGTPEPTKVGKTQSNGCVRLTNWSALELSGMVDAGVPVEFGD